MTKSLDESFKSFKKLVSCWISKLNVYFVNFRSLFCDKSCVGIFGVNIIRCDWIFLIEFDFFVKTIVKLTK